MKCIVILLSVTVLCVLAREGFGPGEQEWGFVTVRPKAHMFWWLYLTTANVDKATERPLIIWLQGGPGASSAGFGNFEEIGPLDLNLNSRNFTWVKDVNLLFVDNPVGTGFSYVEDLSELAKTNKQIAKDFLQLLQGFYKEQPDFQDVPMYITSESYGGKMAADIGVLLDQAINEGTIKCNLQGILLGDAWISPIDSVLNWAPFLYNIGAVDQSGYDFINEAAQNCKNALDNGEFIKATREWAETEKMIMVVSEQVDFYNVLEQIPAKSTTFKRHNIRYDSIPKPGETKSFEDALLEKLMNGAVKNALNVKVTWGEQNSDVFNALAEDFMKPVTDVVEQLLNKTNIKLYVLNGQLDLIVDTPGTVQWVDRLKWPGATNWPNAARNPLVANDINEGYVKSLGNLSLYWVNRAGHMVPLDNPVAMDAILRSLTNNYSV